VEGNPLQLHPLSQTAHGSFGVGSLPDHPKSCDAFAQLSATHSECH
jgi:hypothetical protein